MPLSPLQSWRIWTYLAARPPALMNAIRLYCQAEVAIGKDACGRERARGVQVYISLLISQVDGLDANAHITLVKYTGPPPRRWNPGVLQQRYATWIERNIKGQACVDGSRWLLLRNDDPWRAIIDIPLSSDLGIALEHLRHRLAADVEISCPQTPEEGFHLSIDGIGPLPDHLDPPELWDWPSRTL